MFSKWLLNIKGNNLFVPFLLVVIIILVVYFSTLNLAEKVYPYSTILVISGLVIILKSIILNFWQLEFSLKDKKWLVGSLSLIFLFLILIFVIWGINHLTISKYFQNTIGMYIYANIIFYFQVFLAKWKNFLLISIFSNIIYLIIYILLYTKTYAINSEMELFFNNGFGYLILFIEISVFLVNFKNIIAHK